MKKNRKSHAFNPRYESPNQGILAGCEHPFERSLDKTNRWVVEINGVYGFDWTFWWWRQLSLNIFRVATCNQEDPL